MGDSLAEAYNPPEEHEEHAYAIHVLEVDLFIPITRIYIPRLGILPTAPLLPCKRVGTLPITQVDNRIIVQTLEALVDLVLCEINDMVGLIPSSHPNSEIGEQVSIEELNTNWPEGEWNFR